MCETRNLPRSSTELNGTFNFYTSAYRLNRTGGHFLSRDEPDLTPRGADVTQRDVDEFYVASDAVRIAMRDVNGDGYFNMESRDELTVSIVPSPFAPGARRIISSSYPDQLRSAAISYLRGFYGLDNRGNSVSAAPLSRIARIFQFLRDGYQAVVREDGTEERTRISPDAVSQIIGEIPVLRIDTEVLHLDWNTFIRPKLLDSLARALGDIRYEENNASETPNHTQSSRLRRRIFDALDIRTGRDDASSRLSALEIRAFDRIVHEAETQTRSRGGCAPDANARL